MLTHGKANTYKAGCRCDKCVAAIKRARKDLWQREKAGERLYRPVAEAQRPLNELLKMGWMATDVAREGYMHVNTVRRIARGERKTVHVDTVKTLIELVERGPKRERHGGRVRSDLFVKAIRGLQAQGWPTWWLAEQLGSTEHVMRQYTRGAYKRVNPEREAAGIALARRVGSAEGPSKHVRNLSLNKGWKPTIWVDELV